MHTLHHIAELATLDAPLSLAMGVFDGVHLGHQAVIGAALEKAQESGGKTVVVTFDPHPVRVLRPEVAPRLLASLGHKAILLERMGVEAMLVIAFDRVFADLPPDEFIGRITEACRDLRGIAIGEDWRFGSMRAGDAALLKRLGDRLGFAVQAVPHVEQEGQPVSSTRIRAAIRAGDLATADQLLGREYTVLGTVVAGRRLGRTLGFPTANLRVQSEQLPPHGVYAARVRLGDGIEHSGVANLGLRPTVEGATGAPLLEVHLLDFAGDLYGQDLEVTFIRHLRSERKFDGLEALKSQIARDVEAARQAL